MSRNLIARLSVAAVAIPVILWICYQGGWWFFGMVFIFAALAISEFCIAEAVRPHQIEFWLIFLATMILMVTCGQVLWVTWPESLVQYVDPIDFSTPARGLVILFLLTGFLLTIRRVEPHVLFERFARLTWGTIYVGLLYSFVLAIGTRGLSFDSQMVGGGDLMLFLFGILWIGDTTAMWIGSQFGRHKLAPTVSPNKTVEGFFGGIMGAALVGLLMTFWKFSHVAWYDVMVLAVGCSISGQIGDLVESMWKRSINIKDSSAIIPGHGGVLDRFDSLLFAAPFMYLYVTYFCK